MNIEIEREAFEAWLPRPWSRDARLDGDGDLVYAEDWVQGAWVGWQAARATRPVHSEQQPVVPTLTPAELEDLREFHEAVCCDAGHRVEKQGMRRLAEIGAVESVGFGKHRLTEFGIYLLAALSAQGDKP